MGGRDSEEEEGGHVSPSADEQGRTRSSTDSTIHIDHLIFRSKLIWAFSNLSRTQKSLEAFSRGRQPEVPTFVTEELPDLCPLPSAKVSGKASSPSGSRTTRSALLLTKRVCPEDLGPPAGEGRTVTQDGETWSWGGLENKAPGAARPGHRQGQGPRGTSDQTALPNGLASRLQKTRPGQPGCPFEKSLLLKMSKSIYTQGR